VRGRIILPGETAPPKPCAAPVLCTSLIAKEALRMLQTKLVLDDIRRLEQLRRSMPRARE
jgi:hypothetical protein